MNDEYPESALGAIPVYVGTYTGAGSEGIYVCQLDLSSGELAQMHLAGRIDNPSHLALDAQRLRLYAVSEYPDSGQQSDGQVYAFAIQPSSGELALINRQSTRGRAPCYLSLDHTGRYLLVANYAGGSVAVIPIGEDGALAEPSDIIAHTGRGPNPGRQDGPHPHSIVLDPGNNYAFVPDLGLDKIIHYRLERATGQLRAHGPQWVEARPGSGPRHMAFHPIMKLAYVINELDSTVTAYAYDSRLGRLKAFQTISTLPEGYSEANIAADLHLTPNGKLLLGSNRGHDSIVLYALDQATGWLTQLDWVHTAGRRPRGFAVDPSGTFVLVANQDSHSIVIFQIDASQGAIAPTGHSLSVPSPVCLKFLIN